jgi:hypothetical protein
MERIPGAAMSHGHVTEVADARRLLIERVACSRYVSRSARLKDLLVYLAGRVLDGNAAEIHEQEVGHEVFGRPADYDTTADNIVRVHASMLRKRLEQYFAAEGAGEPLIFEIPKGNYAPVFHERGRPVAELEAVDGRPAMDRRLWVLGTLAAVLGCSTAFLLLRGAVANRGPDPPPTVKLFWSQVFRPNQATDVVLDDASMGLYQDLTGRPVSLSGYFDRDYLRGLPQAAAAARLDPETASAIVLPRVSSYAGANFLWKLYQMAGAAERRTALRFARDYSFRDLKTNSAILVGSSESNPWVEPFEPRLGLRWQHDKAAGARFPVDTWEAGKSYRRGGAPGESHEGYFSFALLPNLGGTGNVLLVAGTGGSAVSAGTDFLADERSMSELRRRLPGTGVFPYFEALIKVKGRSALPGDAVVVLCRAARP